MGCGFERETDVQSCTGRCARGHVRALVAISAREVGLSRALALHTTSSGLRTARETGRSSRNHAKASIRNERPEGVRPAQGTCGQNRMAQGRHAQTTRGFAKDWRREFRDSRWEARRRSCGKQRQSCRGRESQHERGTRDPPQAVAQAVLWQRSAQVDRTILKVPQRD